MMFKSIVDDIKREFTFGNKVTRLILINAAIWVSVNIVRLVFLISTGGSPGESFNSFLKYISLSPDLIFDLAHPWVFFTHMFVHVGFFHILWNMLLLFWFGRILGGFLGDHRIYPVYFLSGIAGAILFLIAAPLVTTGFGYGASAAVMGVVVAAAAIAPDYIMRLLFIGDVKLKYIALVLVVLDLFALGSMSNFLGHIAHLGGAAFGFAFVAMLKNGTDLSVPFNNLISWFGGLFSGEPRQKKPRKKSSVFLRSSSGKPQRKKDSDSRQRPADHQAKLDGILDKIKSDGYESLTEEEKEFLFQASKK